MKETSIKVNTDFSQSGDTSKVKHEDIFDRLETSTPEEAIDSIDKLLQKRNRTFKQLIQETGHAQSTVTKAVAHMVAKGRVIVDNLIEHKDGKHEAQLTINF